MFSKNKKEANTPAYTDKVSVIAAGMQVSGDIESDGDMRIDGTVKGNVFCKSKVVIISTGKVFGDIHAVNVDVHGSVDGNITARDLLSLKANCFINGSLVTDKLQIEPNATFNGHCTMTFESKSGSHVNEDGVVLLQNYEEK
ncbi:MAG TPA: polymer-forming cytoskeletal protein [Flavipsychrobacter sp.]|nr:polymer-forming cytoskeletal protein [Flavipsychrobacter sp.]